MATTDANVEETSTGEDLDLAGAYIAESPSGLSNAEIDRIGSLYGLSKSQVRRIAVAMEQHRKGIDQSEVSPSE